MEQKIKRETAFYITAKDIKESKYIKQEGWSPNYLDTNFGKISRLNIIGTIVSKEPQKIVVDDSTASVEIRSFEEIKSNEEIKVGDNINVIGRPREFNDNIYILPEIVKKINSDDFIEFRKKELKLRKKIIKEESINEEFVVEKKEEKIEPDKNLSDNKKIMNKIEEMDLGDGVYIEDLISNLNISECEMKIQKLLENGDVFEVKPSKIKVL